jgi:DNA-binding MarR family transcriptional regulator
VIKRLIARGVIARRPDPDDRRRLLLTLTDDGVALVDEATARGHCISDETLEPLSPAERQTFLKLLRRLTD